MAFLNLLAMARKPFLKPASIMRQDADLSWIPDAGVNIPMYSPTQTPDGVITSFSFSVVPTFVYYNGAILLETKGYTRSGQTIQLIDVNSAVFAPEAGATIRAIV